MLPPQAQTATSITSPQHKCARMPPSPTITLTAANSGETLAAAAYRFQGDRYTAKSGWNDVEIRDDGHRSLRLFKDLIENDQITHSFKHFLSSEQVTSWNLINNWLSGSLQPEESKDWAKEAIASETFNHQNLWDLQRLYSLSPKTFPTSHYQFHHLLLFQIEFTYYVLPPEGSSDWLQVLSNRRRNAQNYATSQLLAHRLFCNQTLPKNSPKRFPPLPVMQDVCPWLSDSADKDELPVYLWDTELNATIQACELDETPQFICISHTWGRWKSGSSIHLQNVPWDIPCNNIFDVEMLPNHLRDCARANGYRYIWFDLVCIPQERGNTKLAEVARSEISRQALIFRNAAICLCWLNYIHDWSAERATLDFLSSFFLQHATPDGQYDRDRLKFGPRANAEERLQLLLHPDHERFLEHSTLNNPCDGGKTPLEPTENANKSAQAGHSPERKGSQDAGRHRQGLHSVLHSAQTRWRDFRESPGQRIERLRMEGVAMDEYWLQQRQAEYERTRAKWQAAERQWQPSAWFSSLWTLQEAYLRPDMVLCNQNWEPLTDSAGSTFTLEMTWTVSIVTRELLNRLRHQNDGLDPCSLDTLQDRKPYNVDTSQCLQEAKVSRDSPFSFGKMPLGVSQLCALCEPMAAARQGGQSRLQILVQSSSRQCTKDRASAVMAVLGITAWKVAADTTAEQDLILGMFPLEFVRMTMKVVGPTFFLAKKDCPLGTMLPFGTFDAESRIGLETVSMRHFDVTDTEFHPSVLTWTLETSGSFTVRKAAILASNTGFPHGEYHFEEAWFRYEAGIYHASALGMIDWVESYDRTRFRVFAVNIGHSCGVILLCRDPDSYPLKLRRIGCYQLVSVDGWLDERPIDWVAGKRVDWVIH